MKLNAVPVTSSNLKLTVSFYELLGFKFPEFSEDEQHLEPITENGSARLMIDTKELVKDIIGEEPKPGNHSVFALEYDSPGEIDNIVQRLKDAHFKVQKEPWNAFWGQRYAIICDPDGYLIDLYARLD